MQRWQIFRTLKILNKENTVLYVNTPSLLACSFEESPLLNMSWSWTQSDFLQDVRGFTLAQSSVFFCSAREPCRSSASTQLDRGTPYRTPPALPRLQVVAVGSGGLRSQRASEAGAVETQMVARRQQREKEAFSSLSDSRLRDPLSVCLFTQ